MVASEKKLKFSVLTAVYDKNIAEELDLALGSIVNQTLLPDEVVVIQDPVGPELSAVLEKWKKKYPDLFQIVPLEKNVGLAKTLEIGIEKCSNELVARMDSDDFSMPDRFEKQVAFFREHPEADLVCSYVGMFKKDPREMLFVRKTPKTHEGILRKAKSYNPLAHGSCMYRRSSVLAAGNYQTYPAESEAKWQGILLGRGGGPIRVTQVEDYYLWARMLLRGSKMDCVPEPLYRLRWDKGLLERRGGLRSAFVHLALQKALYKIGFLSFPRYVWNLTFRMAVAAAPLGLLARLRKMARL